MRSLKAQYYHRRVKAEFYLKEISGRRLLSTRLDCCKSQYPRASRGRASSSSSKHPLIHVSIKFISSPVRPFSSLALSLCVSLCVCGCVNSESNPPGNVVLITEIREREAEWHWKRSKICLPCVHNINFNVNQPLGRWNHSQNRKHPPPPSTTGKLPLLPSTNSYFFLSVSLSLSVPLAFVSSYFVTWTGRQTRCARTKEGENLC